MGHGHTTSSAHPEPGSWSRPGLAFLICAVISAWAVLFTPLSLRASVPTSAALLEQWETDPLDVDGLQVNYLRTSWDDTEGSYQSVVGLGQVSAQANAPGAAGDASRAALANVDRALDLLTPRDPLLARAVAQRIAVVVPAPIVAAFVPHARLALNGQ